MSRAGDLDLWRAGYEAGYTAAVRDHGRRAHDEHAQAVADFHRHRQADQQARTDALLLEVIHALADAMLGGLSAWRCVPHCWASMGSARPAISPAARLAGCCAR